MDTPYNRSQAVAFLPDQSAGAITPAIMRSIMAGVLYYAGTWSSTGVYNPNDVVSSGSSLYLCIASNTGDVVTDTTTWTLLTTSTVWPNTWQVVTPTTGQTVSLVGYDLTIIDAGAAITALTLALPASPTDKQQVAFSTAYAITLLTFSGGTVALILGLSTTGCARLIYSAAKSKWYRAE